MKKTLIALMALASCAMGETTAVTLGDAIAAIPNVTDQNASVDISSDTTAYTGVTLTMNLKADEFMTALIDSGVNKNNYALATAQIGANLYIGPAIRFNSSGNTLSSAYAVFSQNSSGSAANGMTGMSTGYGPTSWTKDGESFNSAFSQEAVNSWGYDATTGTSNVEKMVLTLTYASAAEGGSTYMTVVLNDGTTLEYSGQTSSTFKFTYSDVLGVSANADLVDSVYLFGSVLDASAVQSIHQSIPEPATATLSLLALAGLATRRRRK